MAIPPHWDVILLPTWLGLATILTVAVARCLSSEKGVVDASSRPTHEARSALDH
jgi:hypothetical protein